MQGVPFDPDLLSPYRSNLRVSTKVAPLSPRVGLKVGEQFARAHVSVAFLSMLSSMREQEFRLHSAIFL